MWLGLTFIVWFSVYLFIGWYFSRRTYRRWFWIFFWGFSNQIEAFSNWLSNLNKPIITEIE